MRIVKLCFIDSACNYRDIPYICRICLYFLYCDLYSIILTKLKSRNIYRANETKFHYLRYFKLSYAILVLSAILHVRVYIQVLNEL